MKPTPKPPTRFRPKSIFGVDENPHVGGHVEDNLDQVSMQNGFIDRQILSNETTSAKEILVDAWLENLSGETTVFAEFNRLGQRVLAQNVLPPHLPKQVVRSIYPSVESRNKWFESLADPNIPLNSLGNVPHGIRGELILTQMIQFKVPPARACWFIKLVGDGKKDQGSEWTKINLTVLEKLLLTKDQANLDYFYRLLRYQFDQYLLSQLSFLHQLVPMFKMANFTSTMLLIPLLLEYVVSWSGTKSWIKGFVDVCLTKMQRLSTWTGGSDNLVQAQYLMLGRMCQFAGLIAPHLLPPCNFPIPLFHFEPILAQSRLAHSRDRLPPPTLEEQRWNTLRNWDPFGPHSLEVPIDNDLINDAIQWCTSTSSDPWAPFYKIYTTLALIGSHPDHETLLNALEHTQGNPVLLETLFSLLVQHGLFSYQSYLFRCMARRDTLNNVRYLAHLPISGEELTVTRDTLLGHRKDGFMELQKWVQDMVPSLYSSESEPADWRQFAFAVERMERDGELACSVMESIVHDLWSRVQSHIVPENTVVTKHNWWQTSPGNTLLTAEEFSRVVYCFEVLHRHVLIGQFCTWILKHSPITNNPLYEPLSLTLLRHMPTLIMIGDQELQRTLIEKTTQLRRSHIVSVDLDRCMKLTQRDADSLDSPLIHRESKVEDVIKELASLTDEPESISHVAKHLRKAPSTTVVEAVLTYLIWNTTKLDAIGLRRRCRTVARLLLEIGETQPAIMVWLEKNHLPDKRTSPLSPVTPVRVSPRQPGPLSGEDGINLHTIYLLTMLVSNGTLGLENLIRFCTGAFGMVVETAVSIATGFSSFSEIPPQQLSLVANCLKLCQVVMCGLDDGFDLSLANVQGLATAKCLMIKPNNMDPTILLEFLCTLLALEQHSTRETNVKNVNVLVDELLQQPWLKDTLAEDCLEVFAFFTSHGALRESRLPNQRLVQVFSHILGFDVESWKENPEVLLSKIVGGLNEGNVERELVQIQCILRTLDESIVVQILSQLLLENILAGMNERLAWRVVEAFPGNVSAGVIARVTQLLRDRNQRTVMPPLLSNNRSVVLCLARIVGLCAKHCGEEEVLLSGLFDTLYKQISWFDANPTVFELMDAVGCSFEVAQQQLANGTVASAILSHVPTSIEGEHSLQDCALAFQTRLRMVLACLPRLTPGTQPSWAVLGFHLMGSRLVSGSWQRFDDFEAILQMISDCFDKSSKENRAKLVLSFQETSRSMTLPPQLATQAAALLPFAPWSNHGLPDKNIKSWDLVDDWIDVNDRTQLNSATLPLQMFDAKKIGKERDSAIVQAFKDGWQRGGDFQILSPNEVLLENFMDSPLADTPKRMKLENS